MRNEGEDTGVGGCFGEGRGEFSPEGTVEDWELLRSDERSSFAAELEESRSPDAFRSSATRGFTNGAEECFTDVAFWGVFAGGGEGLCVNES